MEMLGLHGVPHEDEACEAIQVLSTVAGTE